MIRYKSYYDCLTIVKTKIKTLLYGGFFYFYFMKSQLRKISIEKVLLTLFMVAYLIPNFVATDRIGNQWLYLSVITLLSLIYIASYKDLFNRIKELIQKKAIVSYTLFLIWALFSIYYSSNKAEALVTFNQYLVVFFCFIFFQILSKNISDGHEFILNLLFVLLIIETFLSLSPIISDIENDSLVFRSMKYAGAAANINITSFSFVYKLPLLFYFFEKYSKPAIKIFLSVLLFFVIFIIYSTYCHNRFFYILFCPSQNIKIGLYCILLKFGFKKRSKSNITCIIFNCVSCKFFWVMTCDTKYFVFKFFSSI